MGKVQFPTDTQSQTQGQGQGQTQSQPATTGSASGTMHTVEFPSAKPEDTNQTPDPSEAGKSTQQ